MKKVFIYLFAIIFILNLNCAYSKSTSYTTHQLQLQQSIKREYNLPTNARSLYNAIKKQNNNLAIELLNAGLSPNIHYQGMSMLAYAIKYSNNRMVEYLLKNGANSNDKNPIGNTYYINRY